MPSSLSTIQTQKASEINSQQMHCGDEWGRSLCGVQHSGIHFLNSLVGQFMLADTSGLCQTPCVLKCGIHTCMSYVYKLIVFELSPDTKASALWSSTAVCRDKALKTDRVLPAQHQTADIGLKGTETHLQIRIKCAVCLWMVRLCPELSKKSMMMASSVAFTACLLMLLWVRL